MTNSHLSNQQNDDALSERVDSPAPKSDGPRFDLFRYLAANLSGRVFLASALVGFLLCSALGYASTNVNWFKRFQRFYPGIGPDTNFYPTVSEMKAIVREKLKPGQILVVVGGNSVFNGVGQPREKIWTAKLQNILGDHYCVCNLAFRSAFPFEAGYFAAESLCKEFPKMIYVTNNTIPSTAGRPGGNETYGYLYKQALYRGQLLNDVEREQTVASDSKSLTGAAAEQSVELDLRNRLDSIFYFSDLWNAVAMKVFSTSWRAGSDPFGPRRKTQDIEPEPLPILTRFKDDELEKKLVRGTSVNMFKMDSAGNWLPVESEWQRLGREISLVIPAPMREHVLVVLVPNCPFFVDLLNPDEQKRDHMLYQYGVKYWEKSGLQCISPSNLIAEDYFDRPHLNAEGGAKVAEFVADQIKRMTPKIERLK